MIPFGLHRRIPLLRRPFFQRDAAIQRRDQLEAECEVLARQFDSLQADRDSLADVNARLVRECEALAARHSDGMDQTGFSLRRLQSENPRLAAHFLWVMNPSLAKHSSRQWLNLGSGRRVFDEFVNLDISPQDSKVVAWDLLGIWPEDLVGTVEGIFSEDCFEHFFHGEQTYILCNINCAMKSDRVARILMPKLEFPVGDTSSYNPPAGELMSSLYGVETLIDAVNYGMRFTGHRWLHDTNSLMHMAKICGFHASSTEITTSAEAKFNALNLRDDTQSSAHDLRKSTTVTRIPIEVDRIRGAEKIEDLPIGAALYQATERQPVVEYHAGQRMDVDLIPCINFRSSNLSCFDFGAKLLAFDAPEHFPEKFWRFDETLKSQPAMNIITRSQIRLATGPDRRFSRMSFSPAADAGDYFTVGCAEIYRLDK